MTINESNFILENNWLEKLVLENKFCCGMCYGIFESKVLYETYLVLGKVSSDVNYKEFMRNKDLLRRVDASSLILIMEAINQIVFIAPQDEYKYRSLVIFLTRFFPIKELHVQLKGSLLRSVLIKMEIYTLRRKKPIIKMSSKKLTRNNDLRTLNKHKRDSDWRGFIEFFKPINPLKKLELILSEDLPFPYESIPDDALFEPDLLLRRQALEKFTSEELKILKKKFGGEKKKNKRAAWSRILKVLK